MARTIVEDPEKLQSSLRLMVGAMNLIGMPLNCSGGGGNQAARILLLILGFIFLAVNLGSNGYFLYLNVGFLVELYLDYSLIVGFAFSFEFLTNFILVTGVPLVFWIQLCSGRWRDVWRILVRIQQEMPELKTNGFHRSVFWACCSAISLILLVRLIQFDESIRSSLVKILFFSGLVCLFLPIPLVAVVLTFSCGQDGRHDGL